MKNRGGLYIMQDGKRVRVAGPGVKQKTESGAQTPGVKKTPKSEPKSEPKPNTEGGK